MDNEMIYEATGEVTPMENGIKLNCSTDENASRQIKEKNGSKQLLFNDGSTDDAIVESLFNHCDGEKTGMVKPSLLVDFLYEACGTNETREAFQELMYYLDPTVEDLPVNMETLQSALKKWVVDVMTQNANSESQLDLSTLQFQFDQTDTDSGQSSLPPDSPSFDVKELHHQKTRLQEEVKLLQDQMIDLEENNAQLKKENIQLKAKLQKAELEASELGLQNGTLQEENSHLNGQLHNLKDDLKKMTMHHKSCQEELEEKIQELRSLQLTSSQEKEYSERLSETIRELEDVLLTKQEELAAKDKEIELIAQNSVENQLPVDSLLGNETEHSCSNIVEDKSLATELQSTFGFPVNTSWKDQVGSMSNSQFMHSSSWNGLMSEPEFEEEPLATSSISQSEYPATKRGFGKENLENFSPSSPVRNQQKKFSLTHSTPFSGTKKAVTWNVDGRTSSWTDSLPSMKQLFWLSLFFICLLLGLVVVTVFLVVLSSTLGSTEYDGAAYYLPTAPPDYYPSSLWSKVIEMVKPFCRIEYHGYPPV